MSSVLRSLAIKSPSVCNHVTASVPAQITEILCNRIVTIKLVEYREVLSHPAGILGHSVSSKIRYSTVKTRTCTDSNAKHTRPCRVFHSTFSNSNLYVRHIGVSFFAKYSHSLSLRRTAMLSHPGPSLQCTQWRRRAGSGPSLRLASTTATRTFPPFTAAALMAAFAK